MIKQEQAAGDNHSTLAYQVSMKKTYAFVCAQCLTNSCFCVVYQIMEVMSCKEEREQRYAIQFLHRRGKNCVETLHAIQTTYGERLCCTYCSHSSLWDITTVIWQTMQKQLFVKHWTRTNMSVFFIETWYTGVEWVSPAICSWFTIFQCYQFLWRQLSQSLLIILRIFPRFL